MHNNEVRILINYYYTLNSGAKQKEIDQDYVESYFKSFYKIIKKEKYNHKLSLEETSVLFNKLYDKNQVNFEFQDLDHQVQIKINKTYNNYINLLYVSKENR